METRQHLIRTLGPSPKLTRSQVERYSLTELVSAAAHDEASKLQFYRSVSDDLEERSGRRVSTHRSYFLPPEVLTRDLGAASGTGVYMVGTERNFADALFANSLVGTLPLQQLPLKGNSTITTETSVETAWQAGEFAEITHADPVFTQIASTPKTVGAVVKIGRTLAVQLGDAGEAYLQALLGGALAQAVDTALVQGSGASGQPTGMLTLSGTTSTSGTNLAWSGIRDLIAAAEGYNVGGLVFVLGVTTAKILRAREKASGSGMVFADGRIDGIPVVVSRSAPADSLLLAPWPTVVMSTWSPVELTITPFASSNDFRAGKVGMRLLWTLDFSATRPAAVCKSVSIT